MLSAGQLTQAALSLPSASRSELAEELVKLIQILTLSNQISIAKQRTTNERILIELANSKHKEVKLAILKNSNITAAPLTILSTDKDIQILRLVKFHPQTPGELLLKRSN